MVYTGSQPGKTLSGCIYLERIAQFYATAVSRTASYLRGRGISNSGSTDLTRRAGHQVAHHAYSRINGQRRGWQLSRYAYESPYVRRSGTTTGCKGTCRVAL